MTNAMAATADEDRRTASTRPGLGSWAIGAFFLLAAPFAVAGGLALAPAQGLAGLLGAPWVSFRRISASVWAWVGLLLAFGGWVAATSFWSAYDGAQISGVSIQGVKILSALVLGMLFVAGAGGLANEAARRLVRAAGVGFALVLAALLLVEAFGGMPLNHLDQPNEIPTTLMRNPMRGVTVLVISFWGVMAALVGGKSHERMTWRLLLGVTALLSMQFDMNANAIALGLGLAAFLSAQVAPRLTVMALVTGIAAWLLAAPFVTPLILHAPQIEGRLPPSWAIRGEIWSFVCARIAEQPLLGWGLDASRNFSNEVWLGEYGFRQIPLHPHSGSLQIWFETGAIGAGLGALTLLYGGWLLASRLANNRIAMAGVCGVIASVGVIANVSFGAWQEWWIATIFTGAALAAAAMRPQTT